MTEIERRLEEDSTTAARGKSPELSTLRLLRAALKNETIAKRGKEEWSEADVLAVLRRELKKRQEAAKLYEQGGRPELARTELEEAKIVERYLPPAPSQEQVKAKALELKEQLKLEGQVAMGQLTKAILTNFQGAVDGQTASSVAREILNLK